VKRYRLLLIFAVMLVVLSMQGCASPTPVPPPAPTQPPAQPATQAPAQPATEAPKPTTPPTVAPTTAAAAPDSGKPTIAYIVKLGDQPWFVAEAKGLKDKAAELGYNAEIIDVQSDANKALNAFDTVIAQKVAGIVTCVPDQKIGPAVISKMKAANIPLVVEHDVIKDDAGKTPPGFVGFDSYSLGADAGTAAADLYEKNGWANNSKAVVKIASIDDKKTSVCMDRTRGAVEKFLSREKNFTQKDVISVPYDNTLNGALTSMSTTVTANPSVTNWILFSCNDDGVLGGWRGLEGASVKADNVIGVGLGGAFACEEFKRGEPSGYKATIYVDAYTSAQTAVQVLDNFLKKAMPMPDHTYVKSILMNSDNYKSILTDCK